MSEAANTKNSVFQFNIRYELFILFLSVLSLINIFLVLLPILPYEMRSVILTIEALLSLIYFIDFGARLISAPSKRNYFFREYGWLDLLGSFPVIWLRVFRIVRVFRSIRALRDKELRADILPTKENFIESGLYAVMFLLVLVLEFGSMMVYYFEHDAVGGNITSARDVLWWAVVTVSTVGYGDRFPVTVGGRFIAIILMLIGVGLFSIMTGYLANYFTRSRRKEPEEDDITIKALSKQIEELQRTVERKNGES